MFWHEFGYSVADVRSAIRVEYSVYHKHVCKLV